MCAFKATPCPSWTSLELDVNRISIIDQDYFSFFGHETHDSNAIDSSVEEELIFETNQKLVHDLETILEEDPIQVSSLPLPNPASSLASTQTLEILTAENLTQAKSAEAIRFLFDLEHAMMSKANATSSSTVDFASSLLKVMGFSGPGSLARNGNSCDFGDDGINPVNSTSEDTRQNQIRQPSTVIGSPNRNQVLLKKGQRLCLNMHGERMDSSPDLVLVKQHRSAHSKPRPNQPTKKKSHEKNPKDSPRSSAETEELSILEQIILIVQQDRIGGKGGPTTPRHRSRVPHFLTETPNTPRVEFEPTYPTGSGQVSPTTGLLGSIPSSSFDSDPDTTAAQVIAFAIAAHEHNYRALGGNLQFQPRNLLTIHHRLPSLIPQARTLLPSAFLPNPILGNSYLGDKQDTSTTNITIPAITIHGTTPTFFKIPISKELVQSIKHDRRPRLETVVYRHVPKLRDPDQGMVPLDQRRVLLSYMEAFKELVFGDITHEGSTGTHDDGLDQTPETSSTTTTSATPLRRRELDNGELVQALSRTHDLNDINDSEVVGLQGKRQRPSLKRIYQTMSKIETLLSRGKSPSSES
ncbi:hypothetical protein C8Q75DRAFT_804784 [Abortiporus biennis]|nr:hypothetical protein C8Q75DRAFT_804784 [Abortiporus biennis]